jgi:putative GTP pyrophosphokinase
MTEQEIRQRFSEEYSIYKAWGEYVKAEIISHLNHTYDLNLLIKIDVPVRVKDVDSLIEKAFRPNKNYTNPYNDITDKVGVRFVVLLTEEIKLFEEAIENVEIWECSKDFDFEKKRLENPTLFEYQSSHYIVRNKQIVTSEGVEIPPGTPCEIQIRTLLQHAYSELSHDTIYKPSTKVSPKVHRIVARSMALIETTDDLFMEVKSLVHSDDDILIEFNNVYREHIGDSTDYQRRANLMIIDAYREFIPTNISIEVGGYLQRYSWKADMIREKRKDNFFYRQPVIVLIVYLAETNRQRVKELWPYTKDRLEPIYSDLGIAIQ